MERDRPKEVLRDGNLKASIWRNESEKGPFYAASFARTYQDQNGEPRDTHSFSGTDLLRVSELARKAYERTNDLRREDRATPDRNAERDEFARQRESQRQPDRRPSRDR